MNIVNILLIKKEHFQRFQITDPPCFFAKNGLKGSVRGRTTGKRLRSQIEQKNLGRVWTSVYMKVWTKTFFSTKLHIETNQ